ncbi:nitroreductase family protein [Natronohydrobacter thiooxidans]|jgi:nitroreductase|uniref:nitroreductase family protein n=1 Tax=Natronohydrobacter thiooxidans TaxID=87172 RepID=UPI0008FF0AA6|nr:nitroreductase [Natronohydrobacter thiooxidans]
MTTDNAVLDFLLSRRSRPAKMLATPVPDRSQMTQLLAAAARVPDHGKLEPWRFIVLTAAANAKLAQSVAKRGADLGLQPDACEKAAACFADSPLIVAVVASPKPSEKIPQIEQTLSAGAVCLSLVNAALASGWGACWLTGWAATDKEILASLGLAPQEWIAGFIHIGTSAATPPERPRPDIDSLTEWRE